MSFATDTSRHPISNCLAIRASAGISRMSMNVSFNICEDPRQSVAMNYFCESYNILFPASGTPFCSTLVTDFVLQCLPDPLPDCFDKVCLSGVHRVTAVTGFYKSLGDRIDILTGRGQAFLQGRRIFGRCLRRSAPQPLLVAAAKHRQVEEVNSSARIQRSEADPARGGKEASLFQPRDDTLPSLRQDARQSIPRSARVPAQPLPDKDQPINKRRLTKRLLKVVMLPYELRERKDDDQNQ